MESAGRNAADWILSHAQSRSVVVLAGPGGNGGDAFVVARRLLQAGRIVHCFSLCRDDAMSRLSRLMAEQLRQAGGDVQVLEPDLAPLRQACREADCIVDGLFGSGLSRPLAGEYGAVVDEINQRGNVIISLDVPSGSPSDSGGVIGPTVKATMTLAMAYYKPSHWLYPAAGFCGPVHLVDVDYPDDLTAALEPVAHVPGLMSIREMLPARTPAGHKGSFGHVLIVAGSEGMSGAAILCARAALRAGSGLVSLAVPASILSVVQCAVPEALTICLSDPIHGELDGGISDQLEAAMLQANVLAIGPGLSRAAPTLARVREITARFRGAQVIDADAIHAFVGHLDRLHALEGRCILTPHPGEFATLLDIPVGEADSGRLAHAADFVSRWPVALVLKGRPTVIGLSDQSVVVNPTGNTGLATGGAGDVLTGLLAGLLAGGASADNAAIAGPWIHGFAADRWCETASERSLTPSDVVETLPLILKELET